MTEKVELVRKCFSHETGIEVVSVSFDGAPSNFSMTKKLGRFQAFCKFKNEICAPNYSAL